MSRWGMIAEMVVRLSEGSAGRSVIDWGCPIPYFGFLSSARIATVGLNPSNQEFCTPTGQTLCGDAARFPTLRSLGLSNWGAASHSEIATVADACERYFCHRPFDRWFGVLDGVLGSAGVSYYSRADAACHLDLTPYATSAKWAALPTAERQAMIDTGRPWFLDVLANSRIELLLLNGASVVGAVRAVLGIEWHGRRAADLDLFRGNCDRLEGWWYDTEVAGLGGQDLGRTIRVVGWNHNLQSSFGVTRVACDAVARRVAVASAGAQL